MAKLFFYYGSMSSSKSANLLMVAHNYYSQGKNVALFIPGVDTRSKGKISSRVGLEEEAYIVTEDYNIYDKVKDINENENKIDCVLIDESQFLTEENILQLVDVVDKFNIPVLAYGLKNDFQNNLFEGSKYLLIHADKISEIKSICAFCTSKAIMNSRYLDGEQVREGRQIMIGDEEYIAVCRKHYNNPPAIEKSVD